MLPSCRNSPLQHLLQAVWVAAPISQLHSSAGSNAVQSFTDMTIPQKLHDGYTTIEFHDTGHLKATDVSMVGRYPKAGAKHTRDESSERLLVPLILPPIPLIISLYIIITGFIVIGINMHMMFWVIPSNWSCLPGATVISMAGNELTKHWDAQSVHVLAAQTHPCTHSTQFRNVSYKSSTC